MDFVGRPGELRPHLVADEKPLWCGSPDPGHVNVSIGKSEFRFADVTDGDAMLAALHQAGTAVPVRAGWP